MKGDLNVNSSDYWDDMNTINSTQMENSNSELNIKESWLTTFWNTIFGTKTTDDLTEGSTNLFYTNARVDTRVQGQDYSVTGDWDFGQPLTVADPTSDLHAVNLETMNLYLSRVSLARASNR